VSSSRRPVREAAAEAGHLQVAQRRADGLRGEARVLDLHVTELRLIAGVEHDQTLVRITVDVAHAEDTDAVEGAVGAAVQKLRSKAHDGRGRVARNHVARRGGGVEDRGVGIAAAVRRRTRRCSTSARRNRRRATSLVVDFSVALRFV
jgi:hypothetical protein